jgi:hypothetical protein
MFKIDRKDSCRLRSFFLFFDGVIRIGGSVILQQRSDSRQSAGDAFLLSEHFPAASPRTQKLTRNAAW